MPGRIDRLSLVALRMAASDSIDDVDSLTDWLYRFGTLPRGPAMERDFGPGDDPLAVLGLVSGGRVRRLLEQRYDASSIEGWYSFAHGSYELQRITACKLYVSPRPEALPDAIPRIAGVFMRERVRSFKIGRGVEGLLRPDKVIAYFDDRPHMETVAARLAEALHGCPVHGVPFTAEIDAGDGLLSWGVDPPFGDVRKSWRAWVARRLAGCLMEARRVSADCRSMDPASIVRRAGLEPDTWQPTTAVVSTEPAP